MTLCIHWPHRHQTEATINAVFDAIAEHRGVDAFRFVDGSGDAEGCSTGVDAGSRELHRKIRCATHRKARLHVMADA